jgi:hypothetical protein
MNLIEPTQWDSYFDLIGGGRVYFGRATFGKGVRVGFPPIMAKIQGLEPYYPSQPFIVSSLKAMLKINKAMEEANGAIPDWLRADCFEYHWRTRNEVPQV